MIDLTFDMSDNDCELISDDANMISSCIRRLDTVLNSTLYDEYGSNLQGLLGLRKTEVNLQFLNQTIVDCLLQDERVSECNVECEYKDDGIIVDISIVYEDNELSFEYETNEDDDSGGVDDG